jgi:hypothetical protein
MVSLEDMLMYILYMYDVKNVNMKVIIHNFRLSSVPHQINFYTGEHGRQGPHGVLGKVSISPKPDIHVIT